MCIDPLATQHLRTLMGDTSESPKSSANSEAVIIVY